jgi:Protein of unknown function (DUF4232)
VGLAEGMRRLVAVAALALAAAGCGGTKTVTVTETVTHERTVTVTTSAAAPATSPCTADALSGTFAVVPGSPAAGSISYRLKLVNTSDEPCTVTGIPSLQLLDEQGGTLPTNVSPAHPGEAAKKVTVEAGGSATADARFSPDIPGGSEPTDAPCEPKAFTLVVTIGGGAVSAPVQPPTSVCERGTMGVTNLR